MRTYLHSFFQDDSGIETIEFVGLIVVAAVLIAVVAGIAGNTVTTLTNEGEEANTTIQNAFDSIPK